MLRKRCLVLFLFLTCVSSSYAVEMHTLVKITDIKGKTTYEIMSSGDYTALTKRIRLENRLFRKAHQMTEATWKAEGLPGRYPGRELGLRKVQKLLTHRDADMVEKKKATAKASAASAEAKKAANKKAWQKQGQGGGGNEKGQRSDNGQAKKKEQEKRIEEKEARLAAILSHAEYHFVTHLNTLVDEKGTELGFAQETVEPEPLPEEEEKEVVEKNVRKIGGGLERAQGAQSILNRNLKMK